MNTRKQLMAAGLIAAVSIGSIGAAQASTKNTHFVSKSTTHFASSTMPTFGMVDPLPAVLAALVKAGTITQAQSDAITAAVKAATPVKPSIGGGAGGSEGNEGAEGPETHGPGKGGLGMGVNIQNDLTVITTTLGITAAQLQTSLTAGQSLATIAGAKSAALITALVAAETTNINAQVTAGKLTQAQATPLIAGLTAAVTTAVNAVPTLGKGHHGHHGFSPAPGAPSINPGGGSDD